MARQWSWLGLGVFLAAGCAHQANRDEPLWVPDETMLAERQAPPDAQCFLQAREAPGDAMPTRLYGDFQATVEPQEADRKRVQLRIGNESSPTTALVDGGWPCTGARHDGGEDRKEIQGEPPCPECLQLIPIIVNPSERTLRLKLGPKARLSAMDAAGKQYEFSAGQEFSLPPNLTQVNMACEGKPSKR